MLNGNSMYFYVFWELIYFYVICIYVIWETTDFIAEKICVEIEAFSYKIFFRVGGFETSCTWEHMDRLVFFTSKKRRLKKCRLNIPQNFVSSICLC